LAKGKSPLAARVVGSRSGFIGAAPRPNIAMLPHPPGIQAKLEVGAPDDRFEQEAERVADQIMRMPAAPARISALNAPLVTRFAFSDQAAVRRRQVVDEDEMLQTKTAAGTVSDVTPDVEAGIRALRGRGQPLGAAERAFFEPRFGHDFGEVRLHADAQAMALARAVDARAFTVGRDIVFASGQHSFDKTLSKELLAHELTHVVQQSRGDLNGRIQRVPGANLPMLDELLNRLNVPEEQVITLLGQLTLPEKQAVLSSQTYRSKMIAALGNDEIARSVDAMDAALAAKLEWMAAEGTDYDLVKPRIQGATNAERAAVLGSQPILISLRDGLWLWDSFAKCVELLGRTIPNVSTLIADAQVQKVIEDAWIRSNPAIRQVPVQQYTHEEGGWIYLDIITNALRFSLKEGGPTSTSLRLPPSVADAIVIADFHTHPHLDWVAQPSPEDLATANGNGVPGIVRAEIAGQKMYFPYGPAARQHLAGGTIRGWSYPGATGGVAPQKAARPRESVEHLQAAESHDEMAGTWLVQVNDGPAAGKQGWVVRSTVSNTPLGTALHRLSLPRTLTTRATDDSHAGPSAGHDFAKVPVTAKSGMSRPFAVAQGVPAPVWGPSTPGSIPTAWPDVPVEPAPAAEGVPSVSLPANIRGWQSPYGTPDRIPPRTPTAVDVGIEGWSTPMAPITLTIEGAGGGNGTVTIDGGATAEVSTSTTVELRGQDQTEVGQAEGLRLAAYQGPTRLSASEPFSVAAWPIGARFLFVGIMSPEIIEGIPTWGAKYALEPISDSGALTDCNETQITENVLVHSESGIWVGAFHRQSDFLPTRLQLDHHGIGNRTAAEMIKGIETAGVAESSTVYHQFYRFSCARSGIPADRNGGPKVPNSGFRINHATSKADGKYFIHAQKEGFVNNGVAAGTVDQTDVKKAEIKD
jgi:hypothetical protein